MLLDRFRVQPAEKRKFTIDYSERLQNGNLLTTIQSITIDTVTAPTFVVTGGVNTDGLRVTLYSEGGLDGSEYKMEILVNTADPGQVWEDEIIFLCEDT
jgi:hypothetical protein